MTMPKLSPGHLLLEKLDGSWAGEEIMYPSQWDPKGGVAIGRNNHKLSLGGFALIADYEQERDGAITFTGHGVHTYDPKEARHSLRRSRQTIRNPLQNRRALSSSAFRKVHQFPF